MKIVKYSTTFRLNTLSAMIALALAGGACVRPAAAACTPDPTYISCMGDTALSSTLGDGQETQGMSVSVDLGQVSIGDQTAVSLGDSANVNIAEGSVTNTAVTSGGGGYGKGRNTIEVGAKSNVNLLTYGSIEALGTASDASALAIMGGETVVDIGLDGTISAQHAAAITSYASAEEGGVIINNYGAIRTGKTVDVHGNDVVIDASAASAALTLTNDGVVQGSLTLGAGNDSIDNSGSITGNIDGGGGLNKLTLMGDVSVNSVLNGDISNVQYIGSGESGTWTLGGNITNASGTVLHVTARQGKLAFTGTVHGDVSIIGRMQLGNGLRSGTITGNVDVYESGALVLNPGDTSSLTGAISGGGGVEQSGPGTTILTGENIYTGGTLIERGTLQVGDGGTTGSITGKVTNNGTLAFKRRDNIVFAEEISGSGEVTQAGSGKITLKGTNLHTGGTRIKDGIVSIDRDEALGDRRGKVTLDGGTLQVTKNVASNRNFDFTAASGSIEAVNDTTLTLNGILSGDGGFRSTGRGTIVLTGDNIYKGPTEISAGATLQISDKGLRGRIVSDVSNDGTLIMYADEGEHVYGGAISGAGELIVKGDVGTVTLTGENGYIGGTTIADGSTLQLGDGGNSGSIVGDVTTHGTLMFYRTGTIVFDGKIEGTGQLVQFGAGTTILTGANTYENGTITTSGSTLQIGNGGDKGSIQGEVINQGTLAFARSDDLAFGGEVKGAGQLEQRGGGTLTLTGVNRYIGGTRIKAGAISVAADSALGDAAGSVTLEGGALRLTSDITSARAIIISAATGEITTSASTTSRLNGTITGNGRLVSNGAGTLELNGVNDYRGGTTIQGGTVSITDDRALGDESGGITLDGGTLALSGAVTSARAFEMSTGGGTIATSAAAQSLLSGVISGRGGLNLTGPGTLVLTGGNVYQGGTNIAGDTTLQIGDGGDTGSIQGLVTNEGVLAFNRRDVMVFSGAISGSGAVQQNGRGTTVLTGANDYRGGTMIRAGSLAVFDDSALGNREKGVELAGGGLELAGDVVSSRQIAITAESGTITTSAGVTAVLHGAITGTGGLISSGPGTLVLTSTNTYEGGTTIAPGRVQPGAEDTPMATGVLQLGDGGTSGSIVGDVVNHGALAFNRRDNVVFDGHISGSGVVIQDGTGMTTFTKDQTYTGGTLIRHGTLRLGDGGTIGSIRGPVVNFGSLVVDRSGTMRLDIEIAGDGSFVQAGEGTTVLTQDSPFSGDTIIGSGTLQLGDGGTQGSIQGDVTNHGVLAFNRRDAVLFAGTVSGTGAVAQRGPGATVLTAANTYIGGTTITDGILQLGNGGTTGSIVGDVMNDGKFAFNRSDTMTFDGTISGTGQVIQQGTGKTILNAVHTYQGLTTVAAGTLVVGDAPQGNAALAGGGGVQIAPAGTLGGYGTVTGEVMNRGVIAVANALPGLRDNGGFTVAGKLNNSGLIQLGGHGTGNRLTVVGDYSGSNGVIALNSTLNGDSSSSDQIVIQRGATSGSTLLRVNNVGGEGGYTSGNGLPVILAQDGARTSGGDFALGSPVVAGPYEYTLYRGSADASAPDSWYLRSNKPNGQADYRQEVSVYGTLAPTALMYGRSLLDSLGERWGTLEQMQNGGPAASGSRVWGRYIGSQGTRAGSDDGIYGNAGARHDYRFNGMQIGADVLRRERANGSRDLAGLTAATGEATTTVDHYNGDDAGNGQIQAYSLGAYWTHFGQRDWYLDTGLMVTKYRLQGDTQRGLPKMRTDGWGMTANVEGGYPIALNNEWVLEPQAQLTYQWVDIDSVHDGAAKVQFKDVQSLVGRVGVKMGRHWKNGPKGESFSVWGRMSVLHEALGRPKTEFSTESGYVPFDSDIGGSWLQVMLGVSGTANDNMTLYATGAYQETFTGAKADGWNGKVGVTWRW
jgi:outer membrane autotransporter protein